MEVKVLKTENFKKILISFIFPFNREEKYSVYGSLLKRMLMLKTNNYDSEEKFRNACIRNYLIDFFIDYSKVGDNVYFEYGAVLPDNSILKDNEYSYKKTIDFIIDSIYNPYSKDEEFYEYELEKAKKALKIAIDNDLDNINSYCNYRLKDICDDEGYFKDSVINHREDIDKVTSKDLFNYYKNVIQSKRPYIFVCGNVDDEFISILKEDFKEYTSMNDFNSDYIKPYKINKDVRNVEEKRKYNQSVVKVLYKIKDYKKEDQTLLSIVSTFLNSRSSNILFDYLRTKENLVYSTGAKTFENHGILFVTAKISSDKKNKTLETIFEVMNSLKDKKVISKYLNNIKDRKRINLERNKDSMDFIMNEFIDKILYDDLTSTEEYGIIKNISENDIVNFMDRFYLDTVYYLEGVSDEK